MSDRDRGLRARALNCIARHMEHSRGEPIRLNLSDAARERELLAWAATIPDQRMALWRNMGPATLRWVREHQPTGPDEPAAPGGGLAGLMERRGWRVEVSWDEPEGRFTARVSGAVVERSGATPAEALASLEVAIAAILPGQEGMT